MPVFIPNRQNFRDAEKPLAGAWCACYDKAESVGIAYLIDMIPPEARGFGYEAGYTDHSTEKKFHIVLIDCFDGGYRSIVAGNTGAI